MYLAQKRLVTFRQRANLDHRALGIRVYENYGDEESLLDRGRAEGNRRPAVYQSSSFLVCGECKALCQSKSQVYPSADSGVSIAHRVAVLSNVGSVANCSKTAPQPRDGIRATSNICECTV